MAISKENLAAIISGRAAQLCSEDANRRMDTMKTNNPSMVNNTYDADYDFDSLYLNESSTEPMQQTNDFAVSPKKASNSKLPQSIIESMMNNQIDVSTLNPERSVLDSLGIKAKTKQKEFIREDNSLKQSYASNNGIDYTIIKAIIEECIDRKLSEHFAKQPLNENTLKTIGLAEGKIKLIDNKGNIFMSNLEYQGNLKDKKK